MTSFEPPLEQDGVPSPRLALEDIQSGVLRPRPSPYAATYIVLRIDDRRAGRQLMGQLSKVVASAAHPESPARDTWVSAALSFQGLKALGVPQASLDSFAPEFQQGRRQPFESPDERAESTVNRRLDVFATPGAIR